MFRPHRGCRHKLVYIILYSILYSSWALGIFPFTYVSKERKLRRSKWLLVYGIAFNATLVVLMLRPHGGEGESMANDPKLDVFQRNFVLKQISLLLGIGGVITICAMYLRTFWRSRDLCRIYNQLLHLEVTYFKDYSVECPTFNRYVIQKGLLVIGGVASTLVIHMGMPNESVSLVKLGSFLLAIHFHLGVAFIYRFVWLINRELLDLANRLRVRLEGSSSRVRLLLTLYGRLLDLNTRLTACYDYQTAMMMAIFLGGNIIVSFYMIVFSVSLSKMSVFVMLIMFPLALINNFLDFWLSIAVCDLAERTGRQTSMILKLFNDMEILDKEMERSFAEFALFCSHRRLRFHHCGLFYVNYEMGFQMLVTSVLYLLFLVQFDYMNL
ncbi:GL18470 [Drosophila persimilis]|uniref:Gustatory receptor n=1 Tax=Drosophila persimilis TaxID=7234 RepID=B4G7S5_DROPE|nr:putative gustatory receptor 22d [Drosophila persimilis]EDW29346.1 GL18470 [Drosophila persimilis]